MIYTEFGKFYNVKMLYSYMLFHGIQRINSGRLFYRGNFKSFSMSLDELLNICYKGE